MSPASGEWTAYEKDGYFILEGPDQWRLAAASSWQVKEIMEFAAARLNSQQQDNERIRKELAETQRAVGHWVQLHDLATQDNERLREALEAEKAKSERLLFHRNELRRRIVGVLDEGWVGLEMAHEVLSPTPEAKQG